MNELSLIVDWLSEQNLAATPGLVISHSSRTCAWDVYLYSPRLSPEDISRISELSEDTFTETTMGLAEAPFRTPEGIFFTITLSNFPGFMSAIEYIETVLGKTEDTPDDIPHAT